MEPLSNLFACDPTEITISPEATFRYMLIESTAGILGQINNLVVRGDGDKPVREDILNPLGLAQGKKIPKLVVNTDRRVERIKKLKKAQDNEQAN